MSFERIIIELAGLVIIFGIPIIVITYPKFPRWPRSIGARLFLTVLAVWLLLIVHRIASLPTLIREAEAAGDTTYDGVGGNVATLFMGWFSGLIGCISALIISRVAGLLSKRRMPKPIQAK
jgi:hypothetical protein